MMVVLSTSVLLAACSSSTDGDSAPFSCALGELRGTWRLSYAEQDGSCGPIADETVVLTDKTTVPSTCQQNAAVVSQDKCRMDLDFTCAANGVGQKWAGVTRQVADDRLVSTMTAEVTTSRGGCRSTYEITWRRQ